MEITRYEPAAADRCPVLALHSHAAFLLSRLSNGLEGRTTTCLPSLAERGWLEQRSAALGRALAPGPHERVVLTVRKLLLLFQVTRRWDADTLRGITASYSALAGDLPAWAVASAAGDLARGLVPRASLDWPPSPARLCATAREYVVPLKAELWQIERILKAVPRT
jgi:hypothetical protein